MRRRVVVTAGALVIAGAAMTAVLLSTGDKTTRQSNERLTSERASELTKQLASGDRTVVRKALALPPEQELDPRFVEQLAALNLKIDERTFRDIGQGQATVDATSTAHGTTKMWAVRLVRLDGMWVIVSTAPKESS